MNTTHQIEGPQPTTTEELIVQYLDGELVRKELETVLFERLAHSTEARALLREYLTVRGAIRVSLDDSRFQLSHDLDMRTRSRIEQLLAEGVPLVEPATLGGYATDAPAIANRPTTTRLNRWSLRPAYALLALLFAIGGTWFVTRTSTAPTVATVTAPSTMIPGTTQPAVERSEVQIAPAPTQETHAVANLQKSESPRVTRAALKTMTSASTDLAQSSSPAPAVTTQVPAAQQAEDPADIMLSHRYAKMLNATEKREVVVSGRDRL